MQMSHTVLYIFIEGYRAERYVYSQIIESESKRLKLPYQIVPIEEISGNTGGKIAMLSFFDYLSYKSSLIDRFKGKTTISIFFLDKDIDDLLRTKRKSKHIIYTKTYEIENYFFIYGDLSRAVASSASLDIGSVRAEIGNNTKWRKCAAIKWKDWVKMCLFSHIHKIRSMCNYGQTKSPINNGMYGSVKRKEYKSHLSKLNSKSGLPLNRFNSKFTRLSRLVDKIYSKGQYDLIFKGRWYAYFLIEDIRKIARGRRYAQVSVNMLISNLTQTLDFNDIWTNHFRKPICRLVAESGL